MDDCEKNFNYPLDIAVNCEFSYNCVFICDDTIVWKILTISYRKMTGFGYMGKKPQSRIEESAFSGLLFFRFTVENF
ncbi:hypothetical protein DERP_005727 [Dermatophagoides pteronyssinus]|uniref:Uncharacterized protein n=1 Tax=Dermatophagoides pteronyssinus TaxID=6956 RepID=A0ABQ8J9E7_DERPT|nr:hypothetical protein DERP_005727 [Dermatophagoides pteronyssinus]